MTERKKHPHYQCIRALADGWAIQQYFVNDWVKSSKPSFSKEEKYRIIPDEDGWLPWYGGECPLPKDTVIECKFNGGDTINNTRADNINWKVVPFYTNRFFYRPVEKVDPYAELKAAAKDPTKQICVKGIWWYNCGNLHLNWDLPPEDYQIRDKPQADPYAELKAKNIEGFRVRVQCWPGAWTDWFDCPAELDWLQPPEEYEFEPIPKTRKVKLYQWLLKHGNNYSLSNHTAVDMDGVAGAFRRLDETMIEVEVPIKD